MITISIDTKGHTVKQLPTPNVFPHFVQEDAIRKIGNITTNLQNISFVNRTELSAPLPSNLKRNTSNTINLASICLVFNIKNYLHGKENHRKNFDEKDKTGTSQVKHRICRGSILLAICYNQE